jgi:hypothetical protein
MAEHRKEKEWEIKYILKTFTDYEVGIDRGPDKIEVTMKLTFPYPVTYRDASAWGSAILEGKKNRW